MKNHYGHKGFTLIEVLTALIVTVIGLGGMFMMETATSKAQIGVRDLVIATRLAHFALTTLQEEALEWTINPGQGLNQRKLKHLFCLASPPCHIHFFSQGSQHVRPVGPVGNDRVYDSGILHEFPDKVMRRYCVFYDIRELIPNYSVRVRVFVAWLSKGGTREYFEHCSQELLESDYASYITLSSVITVNAAVR